MSQEEAKAREASEKLNASEVAVDLEARYVALEKERNDLLVKTEDCTKRLAVTEERKTDLETKLQQKESDYQRVERERQTANEKMLSVEAENKSQKERSSRLEAEADSLREEISRLTQTGKASTEKVVELEYKVNLSDSALRYEVERLQKELDTVSAHAGWLEKELATRNSQVSTTTAKHSRQTMQLREELAAATSARDDSRSQLVRLQQDNQNLTAQAENTRKQLLQQRQLASQAEETSEAAIQADRSLIEKQKDLLDRETSRNQLLQKELDALRETARSAANESEGQVASLQADMEKEMQAVLKEQEESHQKAVARLRQQLEEANRLRIEAEDGLLSSPQKRKKSKPLLTSGDEPLGLTDLYVKLEETKDALQAKTQECRKLHVTIQKIEADVAAKTPIVLRQKKEGEMAKRELLEAQSRLKDALDEASAFKTDAEDLRVSNNSLQREKDQAEHEKRVLAKQVQTLLTEKAGGKLPKDAITSVEEMQQQNQKLVGEHRRLTVQVRELEEKLSLDVKTAKLERAEKELEQLRDEQEKQADLVAKIAQERDLYRVIVANQGGTIGDLSATQSIVAQKTDELKSLQQRYKSLEEDAAQAKSDLTLSRSEVKALEERNNRYTEHTASLTSSMEKVRTELSAANAAAARSEAEAAYHREKCVQVEEQLGHAKDDTDRIRAAKSELQTVNSRLQENLANLNGEVSKLQSEARQAERKARLAETQTETAKLAETRLAGEVKQLRDELARQGTLVDSVRRIEATLSAKNETAAAELKEQVDRLNQTLDKERANHSVHMENLQNRVRELEMELKASQTKRESALTELTKLTGEVQAAKDSEKTLSTKYKGLEGELAAAKQQIADSGTDEKLRSNISKLSSELERASGEAKKHEERAKNFESLLKESSEQAKQLTASSEEFKKTRDKETAELKKKIGGLQKESTTRQEMIVELTKDLALQRDEQKKVESELKTKIAVMTQDVENAKQEAKAAADSGKTLKNNIAKYKSESTKSKADYERELELHAAARSELRTARDDLAKEQRQKQTAVEDLENLKIEMKLKQEQLGAEKKAFEESSKTVEKNLEETRAQNELLHKQLESLSTELEKKQAARIETAVQGEGAGDDEVKSLSKTVSELREVIRFMRSQRDLEQSQLDAARTTAERERAATAVAKQSLEEARAELKVLQDESGRDSTQEIKAAQEKLVKSEEQVTLLHESNKLLRDEVKSAEKAVAAANTQLAQSKSSLAPIEKKNQELLVVKTTLESDKRSLSREVEDWKRRVQSLVSKFNQIDPEEHAKVLKQVEDLQKVEANLKSHRLRAEKEAAAAKSLLAKLNKDLAQQKSLTEKHKVLATKLKAEKDDASKKSTTAVAAAKERDQLKEKVKKMEQEKKSTSTELAGAYSRIENFKQRMRLYQKTLNDHKQKISDLEAKVASGPSKPPPAQASQETKVSEAAQTDEPKSTARPKSPVPAKATDVAKSSSNEGAKETPKDLPPTAKHKPEPTQKKDAGDIATKTASQPAKVAPSVPKEGFRFAPGGGRQPQSAGEKLTIEPKPMDKKTAEPSAETMKATILEGSKLAVHSVKVGEAGSHTKAAEEPSAKKEPPKPKAAPESPVRPASEDAGKSSKQQALKEKLLMKKRKLESLKKAEEEKAQKRVATEKAEENQDASKPSGLAEQPSTESPPTKAKKAPLPPSAETSKAPSGEGSAPVAPAGEKTGSDEAAAEGTAQVASVAKKPPAFGTTLFGKGFGSGQTSFGTFGTKAATFGGAPPGASFGVKKDAPGSSNVFLDIKPPSSTAAPLTFGSSKNITLPLPSNPAAISGSPFGVFSGNPFGGGAKPASQAKLLFGSATVASAKRPAPDSGSSSGAAKKQARQDKKQEEGKKEDDKKGQS